MKHSILLAEDSPLIVRIAQLNLRKSFDLDFTVAVNGLEAVEAASKKLFSLILMDIQMPLMNGLEAAREIRRMEVSRGIETYCPIVAITAINISEICCEYGIDACVIKPVNYVEVVNQWLRIPLKEIRM